MCSSDLDGSRGARELLALLGAAADGPAGPHLQFDPSLARGLSYYTGPIFEISVAGLAGSMGGGGRYDNLIGMFQKQPIAAVGFSLGLERVLLVMEERGMFPPLGVGPQVLLCRMDTASAQQAIKVATALRAQGLRVEVFADDKPLGKQLAYADKIGAPFAAVLGPAELAAGTVALKHLQSGAQVTVPIADVAVQVAKRS